MRYFLELCIRSVQAAITDLDAEIIVVDNHSSDDSCDMVKQLFPSVTLIENKKNLGFSKGNNIGVAQAKGQYLCILNPDTVLAEDTFTKCLGHASDHPEMGILGCQLLNGRGQFLPESKRHIPTPGVALKKLLGFSNSYYAHQLSPSQNGKVDILVGAFMLLKKEVYNEVQGFDEDYFMYGEDIDLSYRILKAGYQNLYYGDASILHFKGESSLKNTAYAKHFYGAMQIFYEKHFKANRGFDFLVWCGIGMSRLFLKNGRQKDNKPHAFVVVTTDLNFNRKLPFDATTSPHPNGIAPHTQVVFDGNTIDYKTMIAVMGTSEMARGLSFRILPPHGNFMIGSDSSERPGEVVLLS